jgi:DNA-binding MarR family transcriptional regulator
MVKSLDGNNPDLLDHVGWRLWRLARDWKAEFDAAMIARGHVWFAEARSSLLSHLDRSGTAQSALVTRMGMTKQAVQQLVDELVADGIVERTANASDRRSKFVRFTKKGMRVMADANIVKRHIQHRYAAALGKKRFAEFMKCLDILRRTAPTAALRRS